MGEAEPLVLAARGSKWAEAGHNAVFDLASGLPTQGHFMPWRVSIAREADAWLDIESMLTPEEVERHPLRVIGAMAEH